MVANEIKRGINTHHDRIHIELYESIFPHGKTKYVT